MTPTASLVFVVTSSKKSLDRLVAELEQTPSGHKSVASLLSGICKEADTLSAALSKLATQHTSQLPAQQSSPTARADYAATLDQAQRFLAIVNGRECQCCGGALRDAGNK